VLFRLLSYFKGIPEIGPLLAGKLLGLLLLSFFGMLLLSNVIASLSTFFLAKDLDLLVAGPVDWLRLYFAKLTETCAYSSWMVVLLAVPIFVAYGVAFDGGPMFVLVVIAALIPFLILPTVIGSAVTLLLVNAFPARRTRDILTVIGLLAAGGLVLLFRLMRPEQLARPEGFKSLIEFIAVLKTPTSPWLPSEWVQTGLMSWLRHEPDFLPFYLLSSTSAAFLVLGAGLHRQLYSKGFTKAQEGAERWAKETKVLEPFQENARAARDSPPGARAQGSAFVLPRRDSMVAADSARRAGCRLRAQHQAAADTWRRRHVFRFEPHSIPESRFGGLRPRLDCCPFHLPWNQSRGEDDVAASVESARDARALVVEILGGDDSTSGDGSGTGDCDRHADACH
jgi:hypothetical protein